MSELKIGNRLKNLRELVCFEKWEVADCLNIDVETLDKFENNGKVLTTVPLNKLCVIQLFSSLYCLW